ncbi:putative lipid II flippase FtsW [Abyssibacter sp.]|uniref:putative lipid II flippase FtsW n=1 Tax=Abyssibacter sp. TaxID=2320200 RepID=UPI0025C37A9A|nr:putative lipid II flippase FtsW [Abyssibacter sp.]MCK5858915.1 putative lipid II flippase FtsW [Abyssibacter sp.]
MLRLNTLMLRPTLQGRYTDHWLLGAGGLLLVFGLIMVASASVAVAERQTGDMLYYFRRQLAFAGLGLIATAAMYSIPMRYWSRAGFALLGFGLLLLVLVLIPGIGHEVNGARRWLDLGPVNLQASEVARLCIILYLASYVTRHRAQVQTRIRGLLRPVLPLGVAAVLLLAEPDFGSTAVLLAVAAVMLFLAGAKLLHLLLLGSVGVGTLAVLLVSSPYRLKRLSSFRDPFADPFDGGFQLTQSLIAIGRGEWTGVGFGNSIQKLLYLPETHTDFLFAVIAEELGLVGVVVLMAVFGVLVWRGFLVAQTAANREDFFSAYVAWAIAAWVGLQASINIAVNMGVLPTKGLTMPFISYGGSSLLVTCASLGLLLRVDRENRMAEKTDGPARPAGAAR